MDDDLLERDEPIDMTRREFDALGSTVDRDLLLSKADFNTGSVGNLGGHV